MNKKLTLPPLLILVVVLILFIGELLAGTSSYFVSMMAIAVTAICVTYNLLGGVGSIGGIAFTRFALSTLVISQVGKVLVLEKADQNLDMPLVVISVYALYFVSAMVGVMVFSRIRLPLPKPAEPETPTQSRHLYVVTLAGGLLGAVGLFLSSFQGTASVSHGIFLVLSMLLPFSMVLAVDHRIRSTDGRHCLGWMLLWPALAMELYGFLYGNRQYFLEPVAIVFLTCYVRGFRFRRRHIMAALVIAVAFFMIVSPYYLYARAGRGSGTRQEMSSYVIRTLEQAPSEWSMIKYQVGSEAMEDTRAVNYFSSPSAVTLNRFALIGPDSTLISACATGFHYAFTSLKLDLLSEIPRVLYHNKPEAGSAQFLGQLDGQEEGFEGATTFTTITTIADSYGSFGWLGVIVFAFFGLPAVFVVYESMFDMRKPWGTVATVYLLIGLTEGSMGQIMVNGIIKDPLYVLVLSWVAAWIVRMIPAAGDRYVTVRRDLVDSGPLEVG